jgi:dihydroorotase
MAILSRGVLQKQRSCENSSVLEGGSAVLTRREFSKCFAAGGTSAFAMRNVWAAGRTPISPDQGSDQASIQDCDLVIKGGTVIDPEQNLHGLLDVAVNNDKILEVSPNIAEGRARTNYNGHPQIVYAKGKIVTPGFIDLHVHCHDGIAIGLNADHYCLGRGVTTAVDAGSTGSFLIRRFVKDIVNTSTTRVYAWLHISTMGPMVGLDHMYQELDWVDPATTARAAENNKPAVIGIKVHLERKSSTHPQDLELVYLKKALEAAKAARLPLMVHARGTYYPLSDILDLMRRGDVFTHCFNSYPHNILDANGKVLPAAREARQRGVIFDVGEGPHNMSMEVVEKCLEQDFLPDSLGTDLANPFGIATNDRDDMPTLVSRFMALGLTIDQAVQRATNNPAKVCDFGVQLGTLRPGSAADISIFELREGNFEFVDNVNPKAEPRIGHHMLVNKSVVCRGQLFANQV